MQAEDAVVQNVINNYFTIKGYDLPYIQEDLNFPVELGDVLTIESEGISYFPGNSYQVFFLLKSPKTGQTQLFTSRVINNETIEVIEEVNKIYSGITRWVYGGPPYGFNCYGIIANYQLKLEGGTEYILCVYRESYIDSAEEAQKICDSIKVEKGDFISLGKGTYWVNQYHSLNQGEYGFHPQIYNHKNEQLVGKITLYGSKRASNAEEDEQEYEESGTCDRSSYLDQVCIIFNNHKAHRAHREDILGSYTTYPILEQFHIKSDQKACFAA